ncbi:MAG TPA: hypothetical protein VH442_17695, partial [Micromonosporaceae bacterium]
EGADVDSVDAGCEVLEAEGAGVVVDAGAVVDAGSERAVPPPSVAHAVAATSTASKTRAGRNPITASSCAIAIRLGTSGHLAPGAGGVDRRAKRRRVRVLMHTRHLVSRSGDRAFGYFRGLSLP